MKAAPARFEALDAWRGILALGVALFHLEALTHAWGAPLLKAGWLLVDFFFVLSGFVIAHAYSGRLNTLREARVFLIRRIGRVWPLHAAMLAAFVAHELLKLIAMMSGAAAQGPFLPGTNTSVESIFTNLLLIQALNLHGQETWNFPGWSISAELVSYVVFALIALAFPAGRLRALALIGLVSLIAVTVLSKGTLHVTHDFGALRCLAGFSAGVLAQALAKRWRGPGLETATALETGAVILFLAFLAFAGSNSLSYAAPFLFAAMTMAFAYQRGKVSRLLLAAPLQALGRWSYSIYMVHVIVLLFLNDILRIAENRFGLALIREFPALDGQGARKLIDLGSPFANDAFAVFYLALVIAAAALAHRLIEKPGQALFRRFEGGRLVQPRASAY